MRETNSARGGAAGYGYSREREPALARAESSHILMPLACVWVCVRVCARACVRECVRAFVCMYVGVWAREQVVAACGDEHLGGEDFNQARSQCVILSCLLLMTIIAVLMMKRHWAGRGEERPDGLCGCDHHGGGGKAAAGGRLGARRRLRRRVLTLRGGEGGEGARGGRAE